MGGRTFAAWGYGAMALAVAVLMGIDAAWGEQSGAGAAAAAEDSSAAAPAASSGGTLRLQRSAAGYSRDRAAGTMRDPGGLVEGPAIPARPTAPRSKGASYSTTASVRYGDDWVYDAAADLLVDADGDGYYHYLRVRFDVDSNYDRTHVYAKLYTSSDGDRWDLYYETDDFLVTGATPDDAYEVETDLTANYPPGEYDVLIEIYDSDTGELVDQFGPAETSALSLLPLEDESFDGLPPPPVAASEGHGGGGGVGWWTMLLLAGRGGAAAGAKKKARLPVGLYWGTVRRASHEIIARNIYLRRGRVCDLCHEYDIRQASAGTAARPQKRGRSPRPRRLASRGARRGELCLRRKSHRIAPERPAKARTAAAARVRSGDRAALDPGPEHQAAAFCLSRLTRRDRAATFDRIDRPRRRLRCGADIRTCGGRTRR